MTKKLTWCYLINEWKQQDVLCVKCNKCELRIQEIKKNNDKIMKYLGGN